MPSRDNNEHLKDTVVSYRSPERSHVHEKVFAVPPSPAKAAQIVTRVTDQHEPAHLVHSEPTPPKEHNHHHAHHRNHDTHAEIRTKTVEIASRSEVHSKPIEVIAKTIPAAPAVVQHRVVEVQAPVVKTYYSPSHTFRSQGKSRSAAPPNKGFPVTPNNYRGINKPNYSPAHSYSRCWCE